MATLYLLFFLTDHLGFDDEAAGQRQTVLLALILAGGVSWFLFRKVRK